MIGNWIEATSSSGGTDALLLTDVTGMANFTDMFGGSGTRLVSYSAAEYVDTNRSVLAQMETGVGTITLAPLSLARTRRLMTWNGTAADTSDPTALNLTNTPAKLRVRCTPLAACDPWQVPFLSATLGEDAGLWSRIHTTVGGDLAVTASREYYMPYLWQGCGEIVQAAIAVTGAVSGAGAKLAIYDMDSDGLPGEKISDLGTFSAATTGLKTASIADLLLPAGYYYLGLICSAAITLRCYDGRTFLSPLGSSNGVAIPRAYFSGSYASGMPDPASTGLTSITGLGTPMVMLRGRG